MGAEVAKILVEVDDDDLANAKRILGTSKSTEAVRLALREVVAAKARRELVEMFAAGAFADLADPEVQRAAWS
jgi:Arc/MetJ family transcription regulator